MILLEHIKDYIKTQPLAMHMPGHKRNTNLFKHLKELTADYDLTEIYQMDDLHSPQEIIKKCHQKAEKLWNSNNSFFLVNGSTCGILAGIRACTKRGDKVLVARNCHKSVYNALELCGLEPVYILPKMMENVPVYSSVSCKEINQAICKNDNIKLIILTSPTYEGIISNIKEITTLAHNYNIPVMVDEAHGAHLDLSPYFTGGAVKAGADIVVQSLHKTLPSLTQTAILHLNSNFISKQMVQQQLSIFQTSSPSYLLMASIDCCIATLCENPQLFTKWHNNLDYFKTKVSNLKYLSILNYTEPTNSNIYSFDNSKIVISTAKTNISGIQLMDLLRQKYNIELEMCSGDYCVAMTGMGDTRENLEYFANALLQIDNELTDSSTKAIYTTITNLPAVGCSISSAIDKQSKNIPLENSLNKISAEYVWIYPPGIPIITPGEIINTEFINTLKTALQHNLNLQKSISENPREIAVI